MKFRKMVAGLLAAVSLMGAMAPNAMAAEVEEEKTIVAEANEVENTADNGDAIAVDENGTVTVESNADALVDESISTDGKITPSEAENTETISSTDSENFATTTLEEVQGEDIFITGTVNTCDTQTTSIIVDEVQYLRIFKDGARLYGINAWLKDGVVYLDNYAMLMALFPEETMEMGYDFRNFYGTVVLTDYVYAFGYDMFIDGDVLMLQKNSSEEQTSVSYYEVVRDGEYVSEAKVWNENGHIIVEDYWTLLSIFPEAINNFELCNEKKFNLATYANCYEYLLSVYENLVMLKKNEMEPEKGEISVYVDSMFTGIKAWENEDGTISFDTLADFNEILEYFPYANLQLAEKTENLCLNTYEKYFNFKVKVADGKAYIITMGSTDGISVWVGDQKINIPDGVTAPYIEPITGTVMVPVRAVMESLGYKVDWARTENGDEVTITGNGKTMKLFTDKSYFEVNGLYFYSSSATVCPEATTMISLDTLATMINMPVTVVGNNVVMNYSF